MRRRKDLGGMHTPQEKIDAALKMMFVDYRPIRETARVVGLSRVTVRKIWRRERLKQMTQRRAA